MIGVLKWVYSYPEGKESSPEDILSSSDAQDPEHEPLSSAMSEGVGSCSSISSSSVSSSSDVSSSSLAESSSSSKPFTIDDMEFVKIGPYEFATKNLNIPVEGSRCYDDLEENCESTQRFMVGKNLSVTLVCLLCERR